VCYLCCFNSEWSPSKTTSSRAWRDVWAAAHESGTGRSGTGRLWSRTVYQDAVLVRRRHLPFVLRSLWRCFCAKTCLLLALSLLLPSGPSRGGQEGKVFPGLMAPSSLKNADKVYPMASVWPEICIKSVFSWGFARDPAEGAYNAPPDPVVR